MKYTQEERLNIGRQIYTGELSRFQAAEKYELTKSAMIVHIFFSTPP